VIRLVVTADDVGIHQGMTEGALRSYDEGIVTAVSVAATGAALPEAILALRARPELDIGCHLVFVDGAPLSPPAQVRSLVDGRGRFLDSYRQLAWRALRGGIDPDEVHREARLQVERLLEAGLTVRHLNSHQHVHLLPALLEPVLRTATEFQTPWLRLPRLPRRTWRERLSWRGMQLWVLDSLAHRASGARGLRKPQTLGLTLGLSCAGRLDELELSRALRSAQGTCELVAHPGLGDAVLGRQFAWHYRWESETRALTRPGLRAELADRGIQLLRFRDLRVPSFALLPEERLAPGRDHSGPARTEGATQEAE
jgi:predicted glycoside hydrolase/deacetylase ChbG (UPF0249 family)